MVASDVASDCRAPRSRAGDRARSARGAGSVAAAAPDDSVGEEPLPRRGAGGDSRSWSASPSGPGRPCWCSRRSRAGARGRDARGVAGGSRISAPARSCASTSSHARWMWQPAPDRRPGERRYIASQGEIVHERPWPDDVEYVPMTAAGRSWRAAAARRGAARVRVRRHRHRQDDDRAPAARRADARARRGRAADRPEGRPRGRGAAAADRGGRRPAVRAVRPARPGHRSLAAAVGRAGRRRRAGGRADQEVRALLRRRAAPAPEPDRRSAPRRGPLAAELPAARRRRPLKPLRDDLRPRRRARRRAPAAQAPRRGARRMGQLARGQARTSPAGWCGSSW